jgi:hypothetical protein
MTIKEKTATPVGGRIVDEQRAGFDRRVLTYDWYIPERRSTADRRQKGRPYANDNHGEWHDRRQYA